MTKGDIESENKFVALVLPIADNNYKIGFCLLSLISIYIQLLYI